MKKKTFVGIDAGSETSGIIVLNGTQIREGYNISNAEVVDFIKNEASNCEQLFIVVEDVRPYNMRITDGIIKTIKFLGETEWRLKECGYDFVLIPRWKIKEWIFDEFRSLVIPAIQNKIAASNKRKIKAEIPVKENQPCTFVYVDDRIVANAMRKYWKIPKHRRVGEKAMYNLKDHSWQALALITFYMLSLPITEV